MNRLELDAESILTVSGLAKAAVDLYDNLFSFACRATNMILVDFSDIHTPSRLAKGTQTFHQGWESAQEIRTRDFLHMDLVQDLLHSDLTYLEDPTCTEFEDFEPHVPSAIDAGLVLDEFPWVRSRIDEFKAVSAASEERRIIKRLLYRIEKLWRRKETDSVLVEPSKEVLEETSGHQESSSSSSFEFLTSS